MDNNTRGCNLRTAAGLLPDLNNYGFVTFNQVFAKLHVKHVKCNV